MATIERPRNLFEFDNARYLSDDEIVDTFLPTKSFWRLLSAKNHIILGARGSGKTAIARMLAHPQLTKFRDKRAEQIIRSRAFIGIYVPTKAEWVGGLKNKPWQSEAEKEDIFRWRLNLATSIAILNTIRSCLDEYVDDEIARIKSEIEIARLLAADWCPEIQEIDSLPKLRKHLEELDFHKQRELAQNHITPPTFPIQPIGLSFHTELFRPLRRAIQHISAVLNFPTTTTWMLCLDEAEALDVFQQRILNSFLRTHSDNLVFKITTTPYGHYTLETNVGAGLNVSHDFEYVYIDRDFLTGANARGHFPRLESDLFRRRARKSGRRIRFVSLQDLLGPSPLLNPTDAGISREEVLQEIRERGDRTLIERASQLQDDPVKFGNEILRKLSGAILLRKAFRETAGRGETDIYAGAALMVRCCDGNPRRMIRLFNKLLLEGGWETTRRGSRIHATPVTARRQTQILRDFSISNLARVQAEPRHGRELYSLLLRTGEFMQQMLHFRPLSTDQVTSIVVDSEKNPEAWPLVKVAVATGLLYPNIHPKNPDELPDTGGTFHIAYVLCPAFYLMPRRGKARQLETILDSHPPNPQSQLTLDLPPQSRIDR